MDVGCDLEVDVNGEEVFWVNKRILSSFSARLRKLFDDSSITPTSKITLSGVPGGPNAFELIMIFCYNNGKILVTPGNTCLLCCGAYFMEMADTNLDKETEKSLEGISSWTCNEILNALKQCRDCFPIANSCGVFKKVLISLMGRISLASDTSPSNSSPENSGLRFSFDTRSTTSTKTSTNSYSNKLWWLEDLVAFNFDAVEIVVKSMISQKLDHCAISRFLFYYLKTKSTSAATEKKRAIEIVINLLYSLDQTSIPYKGLFDVLRLSLSMNPSTDIRNRLECMIGCLIDQATLDNLLVPAPAGMVGLYDVDLVLRFMRYFLIKGGHLSLTRLRKAGNLMDLYLAEVSPDPGLKYEKFVSLIMALPDAARESYDGLYHAIDMYLEIHAGLSDEEKMRICCVLNYEKLSSETCNLIAQNSNMPSRTAIQALVSQQFKLKSFLECSNSYKSLRPSNNTRDFSDQEQLVLYAQKLDMSAENEKLRSHLQGMQWRVMELESLCKKIQNQMTKVKKTGMQRKKSARSLPRLCS